MRVIAALSDVTTFHFELRPYWFKIAIAYSRVMHGNDRPKTQAVGRREGARHHKEKRSLDGHSARREWLVYTSVAM